ncbi:hypothetical protein PVK06_042464 [Gossypium arboreum]|uniref:Uncharacterized protein n=1 Tax=Gossypium arboreum TaxID=29729 RepID=A0ABR0ML23_GOSAR|nr:hypothetical protein PVK06_042464 [Gossypium arboreum]
MSDLRDVHGNPIPLTDEHGNPVQLTDERGNPVYVSGVAAKQTDMYGGQMGYDPTLSAAAEYQQQQQLRPQYLQQEEQQPQYQPQHMHYESEDDGMGGRRKKKGIKEKIKEKLTGRKHKTEAGEEGQSQTVTYVAKTRITTTSNATTPPPEEHYHHHDQHEKKSMMEKIKEKLPGHHSH